MRLLCFRLSVIMACTMMLTACGGGEPSESEIRDVVTKAINDSMPKIGGQQMVEVLEVHKNKCVEVKAGYKCSITVKADYKIGGQGIKENTADMLLVRNSDGKWLPSKG